jgi:hypothetical protein
MTDICRFVPIIPSSLFYRTSDARSIEARCFARSFEDYFLRVRSGYACDALLDRVLWN